MNIYALIMAGGAGTRLWPRSRIRQPKQFLDITGDLTMIQQSQDRLVPLIVVEHTLVVTNQEYRELVQDQLPMLPRENIIGEPVGRGTAAAIGLGAIHLQHHDPNAVMAVLPSDHLIKKTSVFRQVLSAASQVAAEGWLVTLGITPSYPETGYGYIERGEHLGMVGEFEGYRVERFVEKPDRKKAEEYYMSGNYDWNSGMFVWKVNHILSEMKKQMPDLHAGLMEIKEYLGTSKYLEVLNEVFPTFATQTIDYGIMENASKVAVLPVDIGWSDVGSWSAVYDVLPRDENNNAVVGRHVSRDTKNSLIYSPVRMVATIGLDDVVVVDTEDVTLVCPRSRAQEVKTLVEILKVNGESHYVKGVEPPEPLTPDEIRRLFEVAHSLEKVLLSLVLHVGINPNMIVKLEANDFDLIHGWVNTPDGKRPLPNITREAIFSWMKEQDSLTFSFCDYWDSSKAVKETIEEIGHRAEVSVTVSYLHETLARALFNTSEEGQVIQNVLGEDAGLVRLPLQALFPFSLKDFSGNENNRLGEKAQETLNRAAEML